MLKLPEISDIGAKVLLQRCMDCRDNARFDAMLGKLVNDCAMPVFRSALARKAADAEERENVYSEARRRLIDKVTLLRARRGYGLPLHSDPAIAEARRKQAENTSDIREFSPYCRMLARQAFGDYLEEKRPERRRLAYRLRYLFDHQTVLCQWSSGGETVCGWAVWRDSNMVVKPGERLEKLEKDAPGVAADAVKGEVTGQIKLGVLVGSLLRWVGHPVPLQTMIDAVADVLCLHDPIFESDNALNEDGEPTLDAYAKVADPSQDIEEQMQARDKLKEVWESIRKLPLTKRRALLLGMKTQDGTSALKLMPPMRVAGHQEIAETLEISWDEFVQLWRELPLNDTRIAAIAGKTENNIRVQRKEARDKLDAEQERQAQAEQERLRWEK